MGWLQPVGNSSRLKQRQRGQWKFTMTPSIQNSNNKAGDSSRSRERIGVLAKVLAKTANASMGQTAEVQGETK